ncbi:2227_t:CDS:2, partial [Ambispora gerdemannii]
NCHHQYGIGLKYLNEELKWLELAKNINENNLEICNDENSLATEIVKNDMKTMGLFKLYLELAENGDTHAQFKSLCYFNGNGVVKNDNEASNWLQKSATNENVRAQFILSKCYDTSFIVLKEISIQHEKINLSHGLNIREYQIEQTTQPAIKFEFTPLFTNNISKSLMLRKITGSEVFFLTQGLIIDSNSNFDHKLLIDNEIFDELKTNNIYCEIISEQLSIEINIQTLKPTRKLRLEIQAALESNTPIENLKHVFQNFGHFFPTKIILEIENLLVNWKENIRQFDPSYMIEMGGDPISLSRIPEWLENVSNQYSEWHIIKRVVVPLYKILDENQQRDIENLFIKEDYVLMNNKTPLLDYSTGYQRIKFGGRLKSNNYQLFGIIVTCNDEKLENVYVRFSLKTVCGFSVSWHDFRQDYIQANDETTFDSSQPQYIFQWILIGCPSEIGYFDLTTRNILVKSGVKESKLKHDTTIQSTQIEVGNSLFNKNIVILDVEYTPLPTYLFFKTAFGEWQEDGSFAIQIQEEKNKHMDDDYTIKIRWCVLKIDNPQERMWAELGELGEIL